MAQYFLVSCNSFSAPGFAASFPLNASRDNLVFVFTGNIALNVPTFSSEFFSIQVQFISNKMGKNKQSGIKLGIKSVHEISHMLGNIPKNLG